MTDEKFYDLYKIEDEEEEEEEEKRSRSKCWIVGYPLGMGKRCGA